MKFPFFALAAVATCSMSIRIHAADPPREPLVTGKFITPQGKQTSVGNFPCNMALSPDGRYIAVTNAGPVQFLSILRASDGSLASRIEVGEKRKDGSGKKEGLYYGLAFGGVENGKALLYASRGAEDFVAVYAVDGEGKLEFTGRKLENPSGAANFVSPNVIAGIALSGDGKRLYAANNNTSAHTNLKGSLSVLDIGANKILARIELPGFPFGVAVKTGGGTDKVYVSSERDGVVSAVDPAASKVVKNISTGANPTALLLDKAGKRLFVVNGGSDTVSVIDTATDAPADTILVRPDDARGLPGATPTGLALSPDEKKLYVSLGDMNAIAVIDLSPEGDSRPCLTGFIPTGWYPTAVAVSPDGKHLFAANGKGINSRNPNGDESGKNAREKYILNVIQGTVSMMDVPDDEEELEKLTAQTLENNLFATIRAGASAEGFKNPGIEHVVYVVKENRTYDQVLGDLERGNGDPSLCLFPREVTPNQHALAERFVLMDNFYVCAEVSADGWNWSTSGMINEYTARNTQYNYAGRGRLYDYEGQNNGVPVDLLGLPDVAQAPCGYIWDHCIRHKVSFRNYGFFNAYISDDVVSRIEGPGGKPIAKENAQTKKALVSQTDPNFLLFSMTYADSDAWVMHDAPAPKQSKSYGEFNAPSRIAEFRREFEGYVKGGNLPRFLMVRLPRDHTQGTSEGNHSPRAMVADNDFAVGQLVEMFSKSPFWKKTAIVILEDDAQAGHDHIDAHRSPVYVISPFVEKGSIDHRFYNTDSALRTMELLLGMPPMNQYDAIAPVMNVFGAMASNDAPFEAILPAKEIIAEVNKKTAYRSGDSGRFDFTKEDSVPDAELNDILWHAIKGESAAAPPVRYGMRLYAEEEEEEEQE